MDNKKKLVHLLRDSNRPVPARILKDKLGVSERMIRTYIKQINQNEAYIQSGKDGYVLATYPAYLFENDEDKPNARLIYIVTAITDEMHSVEVETLAEELNVSAATVEQDIKQLKRIFQGTSLHITRNQSQLHLLGSESDKRDLYKRLFIQNQSLYAFDSNYYQQFFSLTDLMEIRTVIEQNLQKYHFQMTEFSLLNLSMHIGISIERISMQNTISNKTKDEHVPALDNIIYRQFVDEIIHTLEKEYTLIIDENEYYEMQFAIISRILPDNLETVRENAMDSVVQPETIAFVERVVEKIDRLYHIDFYNKLFVIQFALHIEKLMIRLRNHTYQNNPLCDTIKDEYPILFDIAVFIASEIHTYYNVELNQEELAFLVLHLGNAVSDMIHNEPAIEYHAAMIYPKYYDASQNLLGYLRRNIKDHVSITVYDHLSKVPQDGFDFILSVFPVIEDIDIPILQLHPLPHHDDIDKINNVCDSLKEDKILAKVEEVMNNFEEKWVVKEYYQENEESYIKEICKSLCKEKIINDIFMQEVLEREKISSTYIGNGIAIPHSSGIRALKNFIYVIENKRAISWGTHKVHYVILFGMVDKHSFLQTFDLLIQYQKQFVKYITATSLK